MKKFTKICLLTAFVLFITGIVFFYIFGVAGGFHQLERIGYGNKNSFTFHFGKLGVNIPFRIPDLDALDALDENLDMLNNLDENLDMLDKLEEDLDMLDLDDGDRGFTVFSNGKELSEHETAIIAEQADRIHEIKIDVGGANLFIKESDDEAVRLENRNSPRKVRYDVDGESITIESGYVRRLFRKDTFPDVSGELYLYLPSMDLKKFKLEIGGGKLESMMLSASEIDIEIGGGKITLDGLSAEQVELSVGAGNVDLTSLEAGEAELEAGAGNLTVNNMDVSKLVVGVGAGNANLEGRIMEEAEIDCGMGKLDLLLEGDESDYDYNLDCAVGKIEVGNNSFSGLASERYVSNGSGRLLKIDCAVGTVKVDFKN